jgi:hypothetical protein
MGYIKLRSSSIRLIGIFDDLRILMIFIEKLRIWTRTNRLLYKLMMGFIRSFLVIIKRIV